MWRQYRLARVVFAWLLLCSAAAAQSHDPGRRAFEQLDLRDQVRLQLGLILTGHLNALIDQTWGPRTRGAIQSFQRQAGLTPTGVPSLALIERIERAANREAAALDYRMLDDSRSGLIVGVPLAVTTTRIEARTGTRWTSPDQRATVETFSRAQDLDATFRRFVANADRRPEYQVLRPDAFFVMSGVEASGMRYYIRALAVNGATRGVILRWSESLSPGYDRVVVATSATLLPLTSPEQTTAAPRRDEPDHRRAVDIAGPGRLWIVIASRPTSGEAIELARSYTSRFRNVVNFRSDRGLFVITLGHADETSARQIIDSLKAQGEIPPDSFASRGASFELWTDRFGPGFVYERSVSAGPSVSATPPPATSAPATSAPEPRITSGTGFFVSDRGDILTNNHVVERCSSIDVPEFGPARLVRRDARNDLALLRINADRETATAVFRSDTARHAESVVVLGFPFADLGTGLNVTTGTVSALAGLGGDTSMIQITAPLQPGNSGGPIADSSGLIIGIAVARLNDLRTLRESGSLPQNVNFGLRADMATLFLRTAGVTPSTSSPREPLDAPRIAERLGPLTVQIVCTR